MSGDVAPPVRGTVRPMSSVGEEPPNGPARAADPAPDDDLDNEFDEDGGVVLRFPGGGNGLGADTAEANGAPAPHVDGTGTGSFGLASAPTGCTICAR